MDILLNVPYTEKDMAKSRGAKWNPNIKSWYTNDIGNIPNLLQWLPAHNIICESLYLLKMQQKCWRCNGQTEVVLLATDRSYSSETEYQINPNVQILTYVTAMPKPLKDYMERCWRYSPAFSQTINKKYFANHCAGCRKLQGDNYLHEIPSQAFYKKLFYQNATPINYAPIKNSFGVPIEAALPYYDEMNSSPDLLMAHLESGIENRASLNVTQSKINHLFECSIRDNDIVINGL